MIPRLFIWIADALVLLVAFLLAYISLVPAQRLLVDAGAFENLWRALSPPMPGEPPPVLEFVWMAVASTPIVLFFMELTGRNDNILKQSVLRILASSLFAPIFGVSIITLVLFARKQVDQSRLLMFLFALYGAGGLAMFRLGLKVYFSRRRAAGCYVKNLLLIGEHGGVTLVANHVRERCPDTEYRMLGYLHIAPTFEDSTGEKVQDLPYLGRASELGKLLIHLPVNEVLAVLPQSGADWLQTVIRECDYFRIGLRIIPEVLLAADMKDLQAISHLEVLHIPALVLKPPHWNSDALFLKRVFDVIVSVAFLVALVPVFFLIALAIKITTPQLPVFYPWRVIGYKGKPFTGYKFTTMVADADDRKSSLMALNEMTGPVFKIKDDPRVTPLGRFLRKYSLNELPQFWSVVKGDMSLVGPRPAGPHELARYDLWHKRKLSIRPGITCLWQVRGRNKISSFDDWVKMDLEYMEKWSLWLDFTILLRTVWVVIRGTGS